MIKNISEYLARIDFLNHATAQYDKGNPIITDARWDTLYYELMEYETVMGTAAKNSPTQKIHFNPVVSELKKVKHNHPMLSLAKTKEISEVKNFLSDKEYIAMAKMDGLTCSLRYVNGRLVSAETRGDGEIGEDIFHNAMMIPSIPKMIDTTNEIIIDGEIICTYKDFEKVKGDYKNPRNFASGSIRLLDGNECHNRNLTFVAWDIINTERSMFDKMALLEESFHFQVAPYCATKDIINDVKIIKEIVNLKEYPIDGIVFKFDDYLYYQSLGRTDHHFRGGIAYKFYDELFPTVLRNIEFTMGRTAVLTPIAIFDEVDDGESIVTRASLHNLSIMKETLGFNPYKGQKISMYRANQIIPQIKAITLEEYEESKNRLKKENTFEIPSICPYCGKPTEIKVSETGVENLYCSNSNCEAKLINILEHYFCRAGLDIRGLSKMTLEKLIAWNWIKKPSDIFNLKQYRNEWIKKPGFGVKSVDKLLASIEESRNVDLNKFICAIGIPLIGTVQAKEICKRFKTYKDFRDNVSTYDWWNIYGFGGAKSVQLKKFDYSNADQIAKYLIFKEPLKESNDFSMEDLTFVITGKLNFGSREAFKTLIENCGGKVTNKISTKTSFLITNDPSAPTVKNKEATKLNVPIITEDEFFERFDFLKK